MSIPLETVLTLHQANSSTAVVKEVEAEITTPASSGKGP